MITADQLRKKYLDFFVKKGHKIIPSAPLVPENDPTTLFTGSGMQPMIPYLLGQDHPLGTRLVDSQKCFRSQDIDEVGDNRHDSFFEMLGNWSLGDYFKQEQISWVIEFLTKEIGLPEKNIWFTVFAGDDIIPKDDEAVAILKENGIHENKIVYYDETKNWWSRAGIKERMPVGEPGGPDCEIFYEFTEIKHDKKYGDRCHPNCDCGRFMEIGNSVFMTYKKTDTGFVPLTKRNIDFGGGLERLAAAVNADPDIFKTSLYANIITAIEKYSNLPYAENKPPMRIVADHLKATTFLISEGVRPSNKTQGYFLRRLLRRAMVKMQELKGDITSTIDDKAYTVICDAVIKTYDTTDYFQKADVEEIKSVVAEEQNRFGRTLKDGLKKIGTVSPFDLYQTYGFPIEITEELYRQRKIKFNRDEFDREIAKHQELSRTASAGMFKGGLQDQSEITTKYHTATHLLHKALREVLGDHVSQKGSNITAERLRFDFSHQAKISDEVIKRVEEIVNQKIEENLPVTRQEMTKEKALAEGALAFFPEKYPELVSVYTIGNNYSRELCGGPHVKSTGEIGKIKIIKEESAGSGIRRLYAKI